MTTGQEPSRLYVASRALTAATTAPAVARAFVRQHLQHLGLSDQIEPATLVVSELVTNAIRHPKAAHQRSGNLAAHQVIGVQLHVIDTSLYVEVWDGCNTPPAKRAADLHTEAGRGLHLVEALSKQWAVFYPPAGGKVVWAQLPLGCPAQLPTNAPTPTPHTPSSRHHADSVALRTVSTALRQWTLESLKHS